MKNISIGLKVFVLALILAVISTIIIVCKGSTYTIKRKDVYGIDKIENVNIIIEDENVVKYIDKDFENGVLKIKLESVSKGKTFIELHSENYNRMFVIYVHSFGIITFNEFMGNSSGCIIIPVSIIMFLSYLLFSLINLYRKSFNENMYQYKNIAYLGIIIFIVVAIISQLLSLRNYSGIISTINTILNMFSFTSFLLPIAFIVSILMIISTVSLIRKEGFGIRKLLGLILGLVLCFSSILPELLYKLFNTSTLIDIHNENGLALYIYRFINTIIYITITYIECILIGTIVVGIKTAKHIPKFDKDCIIILGCQIRKDGTLTKLLKGRVDRAIEFSKMQQEKIGKELVFVPSGGKGDDEIISEASAMKNYLMDQGIKEDRILVEDQSKNTYENIKFSNELINSKIKNAKIAFSTTNYHVFRAGSIANNQKVSMEGIGAKTKSYFLINAFIREFIATLFLEKKKHFAIIACIVIIAIIMVRIQYLSTIA